MAKEDTETKRERRNIQLNIRLTPSEKATLEAIANLTGIEASKLMRHALEALITLYRPILDRNKGQKEKG